MAGELSAGGLPSLPGAAPASLAQPGTELGGYRIESLLGRGGMGVVYKAHDLALDRDVALKLLAPELAEDVRFRERFHRESRLAASLDHPSIIPIYDAGEVAGQLYIAMRLVDRTDLKRLLAEQGALKPARALRLLEHVADALDAAHERGLVHRDVKPSNVLIDSREHVYLADFGLSRRAAETGADAGDGRTLGTVGYVSPEQIRGEELDGRSDLYSLGCMLYECLAGRLPFTGSDTAVVFAHLQEEPPALAGLEPVVEKALAKEPDDRYQSGRELVDAARESLGLTQKRRSRVRIALAAVAVALVGATLVGFFLSRGSGTQADSGADTLVRIDPSTNRIDSMMPVGRETTGVAAAAQYVWVTSFAGQSVWRIDAKTHAVVEIPVQGSPTGVAAVRGLALVANGPEHSLAEITQTAGATASVQRLLGAPSGRTPVAAGREGVWYADAAEQTAGQILASGGPPAMQIHVPADETNFLSRYKTFESEAVGEGAVWVVGDAFGRTIWKLDPVTQEAVRAIKLPFVPGSVAAGAGAVWVASLLDDRVWRIDPASNRLVAEIRVPRGVAGIAAAEGAVWVASSVDQVVSRIDPRTNHVVATVHTKGMPSQIAVGADGVWVTTTKLAPTVPKGSIGVGVIADCAGRWRSFYGDSLAGAELVLLQHGAKRSGPEIVDGVEGARIAGKPVTLALGCEDGTSTSAVAEARRLVEQVGVQIVIGPVNDDGEWALQKYARLRPGVAFVNGLAGMQRRDPPRNVFSFTPDAAEWTAGLGTYAYQTLGWRRAVTVADLSDDLFNSAQTAGFTAEFCALGGTIVERIWVSPGAQDHAAALAQLPAGGVDGIFAAAGPQTVVALVKRYRVLRGDLSRKLLLGAIAGSSNVSSLPLRAGNVVFSMPWYIQPGTAGTRYDDDFNTNFRNDANHTTLFAISYYDAMAAVATALTAVGGAVLRGEQRFMAALAKVEIESPIGSIRLDSSREAVGPDTLLRFRDSFPLRSVVGVEHTFAGYFTPDDPPPSRDTPVCKRRTPPSWAR